MAKIEQKYKIGLVLDGGLEKPDGVQQYILALGGWYISQGYEVKYLVAGKIAEGITGAVSLSRNIKVNSNGNRLTIPLPASRSRLKKYLKDESFDVLHVQTPYSPMMGEKLIFLSNKRTAIIGTFHIVPNSWFLSVGDWFLGLWCQLSLNHFDKMLSVSSAAQKIAKRDFRIESDILPNVVDYNRYHDAKPFSRYQNDKLNILFFGRLVPRKGCMLLLQAIVLLRSRGNVIPDFRVIVCGSGPLSDSLKSFAKNNDLEELVEFTGFVSEEDKPRFYASADISVFPSNGGESFGIVLLEAMSSGYATVLAGNNVGYASVMEPKTELLFNPRDVKELCKKIEFYLNNDKERKEMGSWGEVYAANFDTAVIGSRLLNIYNEALLKRSQQ
jgi:phosphatidylinositol alpha-mannosyltransferase